MEWGRRGGGKYSSLKTPSKVKLARHHCIIAFVFVFVFVFFTCHGFRVGGDSWTTSTGRVEVGKKRDPQSIFKPTGEGNSLHQRHLTLSNLA